MGYTVAVVGATGAVGAQMIKMLEESCLPIEKVRYLASVRSAGKKLRKLLLVWILPFFQQVDQRLPNMHLML